MGGVFIYNDGKRRSREWQKIKSRAVQEQKPEPLPRDASRGEKEEVVYLDLDQLHPFGVRDDVKMQGLVASVQSGGVSASDKM